jgi:diketogulonate reductase-like aldo/keto reductase
MRTLNVSRIDTPLPVISQGTWEMGNRARDREQEVAALQQGLELGMTLIDTAEMYASGGSEEVVAQAIRGRRDSVFLESKVMPSNASRKGVIKACHASLKRLGTDHLDLYLLHWPSPHPLEDTIASFEELRKVGKIRHWGVSNFDLPELQEVEQIAPGRCVCNQVLYNLSRRSIEHELITWCEQQGILVQAYSPLEQGRMPFKKLEAVAKRHNATPAQVALTWCARHKGVQAIPKSSNEKRLRENAAAADFQLTGQDLKELDAIFPPPKGPTPLDTL